MTNKFLLAVVPMICLVQTSATTWQQVGKIKFESRQVNLGKLKRGEVRTAHFKFRNVGDGPLVIQGVHTQCGCVTTSDMVGKTFAPQDSGELTVSFDSSDFDGRVVKKITVATNLPHLRLTTLTLRAEVISTVKLDPPVLTFGKIKESNIKEQVAELISPVKADFKVEGLEYDESALRVRLIEEKGRQKIAVSLLPQRPKGHLKESIIIATNLPHQSKIKLLVRATITGNLALEPSYIEFGSVTEGKTIERSMQLHAPHHWKIFSEKIDLAINGHTVTNPEDFVTIVDDQGSRKHDKKLVVRLRRSGHLVGNVRGRIILTTSEPTQQKVDVNFYAYFQ